MKNLIAQKNLLIDQARDKLSAAMVEMGGKFAGDLSRVVGSGTFDLASIKAEMTALGYDEAIIDGLSQFDEVFKLSEKMFNLGEVPFLWTPENEAAFGAMLRAKSDMILNGIKDRFARDMVDYATSVKLSGKPSSQVIQEVSERFATEGRRIGTEVDTALASFDRASKKMLYDNAGVEKYVYVGPLDKVTRDVCAAVMSDDRQRTGWTAEDIANFPGVDIVTGGGYNCRHDWMPFDRELESELDKIYKDVPDAENNS